MMMLQSELEQIQIVPIWQNILTVISDIFIGWFITRGQASKVPVSHLQLGNHLICSDLHSTPSDRRRIFAMSFTFEKLTMFWHFNWRWRLCLDIVQPWSRSWNIILIILDNCLMSLWDFLLYNKGGCLYVLIKLNSIQILSSNSTVMLLTLYLLNL